MPGGRPRAAPGRRARASPAGRHGPAARRSQGRGSTRRPSWGTSAAPVRAPRLPGDAGRRCAHATRSRSNDTSVPRNKRSRGVLQCGTTTRVQNRPPSAGRLGAPRSPWVPCLHCGQCPLHDRSSGTGHSAAPLAQARCRRRCPPPQATRGSARRERAPRATSPRSANAATATAPAAAGGARKEPRRSRLRGTRGGRAAPASRTLLPKRQHDPRTPAQGPHMDPLACGLDRPARRRAPPSSQKAGELRSTPCCGSSGSPPSE
mmetsp:Transcript_1542/g.3944  ORF Transcript_1542/g.3944 Transcript_1542/m.3944 type:complete len:262 (-) Transcript_1542:333-1118(-)